MSISSQRDAPTRRSETGRPGTSSPTDDSADRQLRRWGGVAGLVGVLSLFGSLVVVISLGLPDASDPKTLTDFTNIESGRIAEHFLYLGALVLFALHLLVLNRLLRRAHPAAALFGTATAVFGLIIMAASSLLHVSTAPLADLYNTPGASPQDLRAIEYAWYGAQSVFDTMLATGVLLVPIGLVLVGIAMRSEPAFSSRLAALTIGLGTVGVIGAAFSVIVPGSVASAASVLAMAVVFASTGWWTLKLGRATTTDLTDGPRS